MMRKSLLVLAVCAALSVAVYAASSNVQKSTISVGDFAIKVSKVLGKPAGTPQAAAESLRSLGVEVGDLNARLTEGVAARLLSDLGVNVKTQTPGNGLSAGKVDQLLATASLVNPAVAAIEPAGLPTDCLAVKNRGDCQTCCKVFYGCDLNTTCDFAKSCTIFCKQVLPPGQQSPSDPEP